MPFKSKKSTRELLNLYIGIGNQWEMNLLSNTDEGQIIFDGDFLFLQINEKLSLALADEKTTKTPKLDMIFACITYEVATRVFAKSYFNCIEKYAKELENLKLLESYFRSLEDQIQQELGSFKNDGQGYMGKYEKALDMINLHLEDDSKVNNLERML